ncbi:MAG: glycosyltransferase family 4 protein [Vicinamibacterales bacterium]
MLSRSAEPEGQFLHISAFPAGVTQQGNPYFALCHAALAKRGISVSDDLEIDLSWLKARAGSIDAVHLHWPERFWRRGRFGGLSRVQRAARACDRLLQLNRFVRAARRHGMRCIWTVHNLEPHEGAYRWDRYGYRLLARECDLVICHSHSATRAVGHTYRPRGRLVVMPIGDPAGVHPRARPRAEVLAELRLDPQRPVVSCLGRLRDYKGLDLACAALERLNGRVQLIIGGPRHADFDVASILAMITRTPGTVLIDRQLTDQEFADLTAASDAVLLPYRAITGSSALLAALGFGRGVVTSDLPYFQEILADDPDAGVIVSGWDAAAWANGILEYLERPAGVRSRAALGLAARYSWDRCVEPLVAALGVQDRAGAARVPTAGATC